MSAASVDIHVFRGLNNQIHALAKTEIMIKTSKQTNTNTNKHTNNVHMYPL